MKLKISNRHVAIAGFVAALLTAAYYFGIAGARTLAGLALFFFLPFYLILGRVKIEADERVFFAFFLGLGLFSAVVFYVGRLVPHYRLAVAIAFVLLLLLPFALRLKKVAGASSSR